MHHASVKRTINGHSHRFLRVNFALNASVSQSSYSMMLMKQAEKVLPFNFLNFYLRVSIHTAI